MEGETPGSAGQDETAAPQAQLSASLADVLPGDGLSVVIHSNAPWVGSGYGTQSALFGAAMAERLGYRVAFSSFYGLKGARQVWRSPAGKPYLVYPQALNSHGNEVMGAHFKDWIENDPSGSRRGMFLTLCDPWVLHAPIVHQLPAVSWIPIDHEPLIPRTHEWLQKSGAVPVAMARWGQEVLRANGHDALYVPHGFDANVFKPRPREELRDTVGIPKDSFVVGIVAANFGNPARKCFFESVAAFKIFKERHDDAVLYFHTLLQPGQMGTDLVKMCRANQVYPMASDQYRLATHYPASAVAGLMNSFDVLLNPSQGEGFGCTMVEAMACGTPVITTNFSASPEVAPVSAGNWTVDGQEVWTHFDSKQMRPSIEGIVDALEQAYADSEDERNARRESVAAWALSEYEAGYVTDTYWKPALRDAWQRIQFDRREQALYPKP